MKTARKVFAKIAQTSAVLLCITLLGCTSTPQHTNVLVFGTNTKFALDLSQDATSGIGITLGYKRLEAVWMLLLPNQASKTGSGLQPSPCEKETDCPKFIGEDSSGQHDTYSVLASFGSKLGAGVDATGKDAKVNGEIAQYFATGLAARILAKNGAALVSTNGDSLTNDERALVKSRVTTIQTELDDLILALTNKSTPSNVDATKVAAAFAKVPGKDISKTRQDRITAAIRIADLRNAITSYAHADVAKPMLDTLNAK